MLYNSSYADCPQLLKEFLFYIETIRGLSRRTVDGYFIDLRVFFRFLKLQRGLVTSDVDFDEIDIFDVDLDLIKSVTSADIYEYLHFITRERENGTNTRSRKISSLRSFFGYLHKKTNKISQNPIANIDVPSIRKSLPKYLNFEESLALLRAVQGEFFARDYCILTLFLNCGMRLSELVGIDNTDIRDDTLRLLGKGNKERMVYLNDACLYAIDNYKKERSAAHFKSKDDKAFFLNRNGKRLTGRRVEQIVDDYLEKAGLSGRGFSAHKLRHTAATLMYQYGGVDMLALKEILGHAHVSTTEIYTHIGNEQLKKAMSASPLSNVKMREASVKEAKETKSDGSEMTADKESDYASEK